MINGLQVGIYEILPVKDNVNYGLDLTGGVYVVLAKEAKGDPVTDEKNQSSYCNYSRENRWIRRI